MTTCGGGIARKNASHAKRTNTVGASESGPWPRVTYSVTIAPAAERQLHKFDPPVRRTVHAAIELLSANPRPPKMIQLAGGAGEWRVRTGDHRVIYEIHDAHLIVLVLKVGRRREIDESRERDRAILVFVPSAPHCPSSPEVVEDFMECVPRLHGLTGDVGGLEGKSGFGLDRGIHGGTSLIC